MGAGEVDKPYQAPIIAPSRVFLYVWKHVWRGSLKSEVNILTLAFLNPHFFLQNPAAVLLLLQSEDP